MMQLGANNTDTKVNATHPAGRQWRWPQPPDQIYTISKKMSSKISPPCCWQQGTIQVVLILKTLSGLPLLYLCNAVVTPLRKVALYEPHKCRRNYGNFQTNYRTLRRMPMLIT